MILSIHITKTKDVLEAKKRGHAVIETLPLSFVQPVISLGIQIRNNKLCQKIEKTNNPLVC